MVRLDEQNILRSANKSVDGNSLVFRHHGRLHRALRGEAAGCALELLGLDIDHEVWKSGLVRFRLTDLSLAGYQIVVEVEEVDVVTFPQEWPVRMLQEAGLTVLRVARALAGLGMGLVDAHPWNILFQSTRPVFIDLGSLRRGVNVPWDWVCEWRIHCLVPVLLHARKHYLLADGVRAEHSLRTIKKWFDRPLLRSLYPRRVPALYHRHHGDPVRLLSGLERYLEGLVVREPRGEWSDYRLSGAEIGNVADYEPKLAAVDKFLRQIPAGRCLDLGCNAGYFSRMAVSLGHQVVATDLDEVALARLFQTAREQNLPILPLRMDVMWPTPSFGMALAFPDALHRLRSKTVLVIALLHHLCKGLEVRFEMFASMMDRLAETDVIVEFIPKEDEHVSKWPLAREAWYTLENLVRAMSLYFPEHEILESNPAPRKMLHFRRKTTE